MNELTQTTDQNSLVVLTTNIVTSFVSNNHVATADIGEIIANTYAALSNLAGTIEAPAQAQPQEPAVSIRSSIKPDYLVCLEDGKKVKMLKRYLRTNFDMSVDEYRAKWSLPSDYPMVAPNYSEKRRDLAKLIGLGRKGRPAAIAEPAETVAETVVTVTEAPVEAPKAKRGRKPKVAAPEAVAA